MMHARSFRPLALFLLVSSILCLSADHLFADHVLAEVFELPDGQTWPTVDDEPSEQFHLDVMALPVLPRRYSEEGLIVDRQSPFVLRLTTTAKLPEGDYDFLLRAMNRSRFLIDDRQVAATEFKIKFNDGHNEVPELTRVIPNLRMLAPGHAEQIVSFRASGKPHRFVVEAIVGGKQKRPETGELCLCVRDLGATEDRYVMMGAAHRGETDILEMPLTDLAWDRFVQSETRRVLKLNRRERKQADANQTYWSMRHEQAREHIASLDAIPIPAGLESERDIDRFVLETLDGTDIPASIDDYRFLRRLALDSVGTVPTRDEIEVFLSDSPEVRRTAAIDRYLGDDRWADHWVSYWQDVLAEKPWHPQAQTQQHGSISLVDSRIVS